MRCLAFGLVLGFAACGKSDPGPTCAAVVDHMLVVMKQGMTGHEGLEMGNRKVLIDSCEQRHFSKPMRTCLFGAKDLAAIAECAKIDQPASERRPMHTREPPAPPAPPPTGSAPSAPAGGSGTPPP